MSPEEKERVLAPSPSKPYWGLEMTPEDEEHQRKRSEAAVRDMVEHSRKIQADIAAGKPFRSHLAKYPKVGDW